MVGITASNVSTISQLPKRVSIMIVYLPNQLLVKLTLICHHSPLTG